MKNHKILLLYFFFQCFFLLATEQSTLIEKPIYVVVTSYNNAPWVEKNLDSILCQQYTNYRVIYLDDASTDETALLVQQYIQEHNLEDKITFIQNKTRQWKMKNIYNVYHMADDWEIICQVDGDDWLPDDHVFQRINEAYTKNNIWITYGKFIRSKGLEATDKNKTPEYIGNVEPKQLVPSVIAENNAFRRWNWEYVPIRTFYAWLFKLVKLEDFIGKNVPNFEGKLFPVSDDQAMMFPMLEMASSNHIHCFPELMYIANMAPSINQTTDYNVDTAQACVAQISATPPYIPLNKPSVRKLKKYLRNKASLIVLCNNLENIFPFLKSLEQVKGYEDICIIYGHQKTLDQETLDDDYLAYKEFLSPLTKLFNITLPEEQLTLAEYLQNLKTDHVLITNTDYPFTNGLNLHQCIYFLEKTFAYGFYLNLEMKKKPENVYCTDIEDNIFIWKFIFNQPEWTSLNNMQGTLYRKKDLTKIFSQISTKGMETFTEWKNEKVFSEKIGLFYGSTKL